MKKLLLIFVYLIYFFVFVRAREVTLEEALAAAKHWRKKASEWYCSHEGGVIQENGGWCLHPENMKWNSPRNKWLNAKPIYGRGAKEHLPPDEKLAKVISTYLLEFSGGKSLTLFDIGAGIGQYGRYFQAYTPSIIWKGFDGAGNTESFTENYVKWIDVTNPIFDTVEGVADFVMSLEVGEHIPREYTDNFLSLLDSHTRYGIILSWALPKQDGIGHVNCLTNQEVIALLKQRGFYQNEWSVRFLRDARAQADYFWFRRSFMVFVRENATVFQS